MKRNKRTTYAVITMNVVAAQLGRRGKAAVGGYMGVVIKETHYVPPVLELKGNNDR